jgi:hypothetical protein
VILLWTSIGLGAVHEAHLVTDLGVASGSAARSCLG